MSVVITTRDRPAALAACLASIGAQFSAPDRVVVVENGISTADVRSLAREHGAQYVACPGGGLSAGRNRGLAVVETEVVAFLDDDATADPRWIGALLSGMAYPETVIVTGRILPSTNPTDAQARFASHGGLDLGPESFTLSNVSKWWMETASLGGMGYGGNMAFRTAALREAGAFRESLGLGAPLHGADEQYAFLQVLRRGGTARYVADAVVSHPYPRDMAELETRHLRDVERVTGFVTLLLTEEPAFRKAVLGFLVQGLLGRPRPWRSRPSHAFDDLVPRRKSFRAALRGPTLYARARRFESGSGVDASPEGRRGAPQEPS